MKDILDQTYYELLEIDASATQEEILKAYNRARATYGHNSPALYSLFNKEEAQELLKLIDEAYAVLSNQFKRKQYDNEGLSPEPVPQPVKERPVERRKPQRPVNENVAEAKVFEDSPSPVSGTFENERPRQSHKAETTRAEKKVGSTDKQSGSSRAEAMHGTGTTPFGTYVIDPLFEEEIKCNEEFSGIFIQKVRLYKNINLDQICETTKISRPYLIAVESNNFTSLPAPVFVRGFIVQISKILGLDTNKVCNSFIRLLKEAQKK